jgi:hypothetical protein
LLNGIFYAVGRDITHERNAKQDLIWKNELTKMGEIVSKSGVWEINTSDNKVILSEGLHAILEVGERGVIF